MIQLSGKLYYSSRQQKVPDQSEADGTRSTKGQTPQNATQVHINKKLSLRQLLRGERVC